MKQSQMRTLGMRQARLAPCRAVGRMLSRAQTPARPTQRMIRMASNQEGGGATTEDKRLKETLADLDALLGIKEEPAPSPKVGSCDQSLIHALACVLVLNVGWWGRGRWDCPQAQRLTQRAWKGMRMAMHDHQLGMWSQLPGAACSESWPDIAALYWLCWKLA